MFNLYKELKEIDKTEINKLIWTIDMKAKDDTIPDEAKFKVKISSEAVDRDWEIVKADWIDFKWYKKNPIVLANHWYTVENIIGKTTKVYQEGKDTYAEWYFSQTNPKAKLFQDLYNEGMLKTVSIWFMVKERDANDRNIITKCELLEYSWVAVQSNRDAMDMSWKELELHKKGVEAGIIIEKNNEEGKENLANNKNNDSMAKNFETLSKEFSTFKKEISEWLAEVKDLLKTLADDKVKEVEAKQLDQKVKKSAQNLVKGLSAYLEQSKKAK